jgi:hypothetical protein
MVSYIKPKHGSTGKTKKHHAGNKTKGSGGSWIGLPRHAAQFHDQPISFNMNYAKAILHAFLREYRPRPGEPHA